MTDTVIRAENLGKRYCIGERERYLALRVVLARAVSAPAIASGHRGGRHGSGGPPQKAVFRRWEVVEPRTEPSNLLTTSGPAGVQFEVEVHRPVRTGHHGIALFDAGRHLIWA
jgi:hypothetical protein